MDNRNSYVDFLRAVGFISIVMVHCNVPNVLYTLNLFNVPLMVVVSGLVSNSSIKRSYFHYIKARLKRLLIPTWIFVTAYLIFLYILTQYGFINHFKFNINSILYSYLLLDSESGGIGFVWIIRVFLLTMLVTPFICKIYNKLNGGGYLLCILSLLLLQIVLCQVDVAYNSILYKQFLLYFVGYQTFIWFGIGIKNLNKCQLSILAISLLSCSTLLLVYRVFICNADIFALNFKTPPYLDYQIYGMAISSLFWRLRFRLIHIADFPILKFIGQNTIWLYFWHIPIVITMNSLLNDFHWSLVFTITLTLSCAMYYFQFKIVNKTNKKFLNKYFIG